MFLMKRMPQPQKIYNRLGGALVKLAVCAVILVTSSIFSHDPLRFIRGYRSSIEKRLKKPIASAHVTYPPSAVRLAVFKQERLAELWLPDKSGHWRFVKNYKFTATSGGTGPKIFYGDLQIPEGQYAIDAMWPSPEYHFAMHVAYPNAFDLAMLELEGRDIGYVSTGINVHGGAVSYGCVVIGDRNIEELFLLASLAGMQNTEVFIYPHDTDRANPQFRACEDCPVWYGELQRLMSQTIGAFKH
jgi:hypothetical protein